MINRLGAWILPGVVMLSVGLGGVVAQIGDYPAWRSVSSFILLGLGVYFLFTADRRQFPWPLFMILPAVLSLVDLFGFSYDVPLAAYGYGAIIIVGVWLLIRPGRTDDEEE